MDYNIVDDMKKVRENICMFELTKIMSQWDILLRELRKTSSGNVISSDKGSNKSLDTLTSILNALMMDANTLYSPFLLTFEIFNFNVHNLLVDLSASVNVMPLSVSNKINAKWEKIDSYIIQLDMNHIQVIGELRDVIIRLSYDGQFHQCINIVIVDISEAYGVLLIKGWSSKLEG